MTDTLHDDLRAILRRDAENRVKIEARVTEWLDAQDLALNRRERNAAIRILLQVFESASLSRPDDYELKPATEISRPYPSFISLVVEVGMKGDEATLASLICRTRAHLFIGPRGGITTPGSKSKRGWKAIHHATYSRY